MKWVSTFPLSKKNKIERLYYNCLTTPEFNNSKETSIKEFREKATIYILNEDNTFYDLDMNLYKPKD